jgi:hypothetical protein
MYSPTPIIKKHEDIPINLALRAQGASYHMRLAKVAFQPYPPHTHSLEALHLVSATTHFLYMAMIGQGAPNCPNCESNSEHRKYARCSLYVVLHYELTQHTDNCKECQLGPSTPSMMIYSSRYFTTPDRFFRTNMRTKTSITWRGGDGKTNAGGGSWLTFAESGDSLCSHPRPTYAFASIAHITHP